MLLDFSTVFTYRIENGKMLIFFCFFSHIQQILNSFIAILLKIFGRQRKESKILLGCNYWVNGRFFSSCRMSYLAEKSW
jgi:hypothetical protein